MQRIEFRDGERDVADHLAALMSDMETWTMTYEEAVKRSDSEMLRRRLDSVQGNLVAEHMARLIR